MEEEVWGHWSVQRPQARILGLSFVVSYVYWAFAVILCWTTGLVLFLPDLSHGWPTYGAIFQLGAGALFLMGALAEASTTLAFVGLLLFLSLLSFLADALSAVALSQIIIGYYLGLSSLPATSTLVGTLATAGLVVLMVMLDLLVLYGYVQTITNVTYLRRRLRAMK